MAVVETQKNGTEESNKQKPLVSICCITYNHEKYIADAIEGFLMQKTNFPIEIIIHDDASADKTAEIIRTYEEKHPDLIKPIYQKENQYSKGIKISPTFVYPKAQGKYIALCEGDDYWTDPLKLQKQVDYMEANPECSMCFHAAEIVYEDGSRPDKIHSPRNKNTKLRTEEVILGGGGLCPTASILFRKHLMDNPPQFYLEAPVGDYPLALICATNGAVYYVNEVMSVYRKGIAEAWSKRVAANLDKRKKHLFGIIKMYDQFNKYTNYHYERELIRQKSKSIKNFFCLFKNKHGFKNEQFNELSSYLSIKDKLVVNLVVNMPRTYSLIKKLKSYNSIKRG
ncbi:glycosyltransferase [Heliorestis acidaminivorans]|uniref:Glycosyltransferase n=1 Tax=Heliorestis acidaminivorans TaxID=553427 RepID=A0A6I0F2W1_9FIRM|nr:glycosyltransferase [Heliorestis acidaminivorans]KAB2953763.1 glycosyltransferase [Heliorestis acidaminivorans]